MQLVGFSAGAIAKSDYLAALTKLRTHRVSVVELSTLRYSELYPLVRALPELELSDFQVVSFHAPSNFASHQECFVVNMLQKVIDFEIPIVIHPDTIYSLERWASFSRLVVTRKHG